MENTINLNILSEKQLLTNEREIDFYNFQKWDLEHLNYIYVHPVIDKCLSYDRHEITDALNELKEYQKLEAIIAINNVGWGCIVCEKSI